MRKKKKFRPIITRVKLNPEQAVLACDCYTLNYSTNATTGAETEFVCVYGTKSMTWCCASVGGSVGS